MSKLQKPEHAPTEFGRKFYNTGQITVSVRAISREHQRKPIRSKLYKRRSACLQILFVLRHLVARLMLAGVVAAQC